MRSRLVTEDHDPSAPGLEDRVAVHPDAGAGRFEVDRAPIWPTFILTAAVEVIVGNRRGAIHAPEDDIAIQAENHKQSVRIKPELTRNLSNRPRSHKQSAVKWTHGSLLGEVTWCHRRTYQAVCPSERRCPRVSCVWCRPSRHSCTRSPGRCSPSESSPQPSGSSAGPRPAAAAAPLQPPLARHAAAAHRRGSSTH